MNKLETLVKDFIASESRKHGFRVKFYDSYMAQLDGKDYSSGYFHYPEISKLKNPYLAVGTKRATQSWVETLLHEYCHFLQWKEKSKLWIKYMKNPSIKNTTNLEIDCEKRTIKLIKKLKLEAYIDVKKYAQGANSYITFYHIYERTGKWYQKAPFEIQDIYAQMPTKIGSIKSLKPGISLIGLYIENCYKKGS